jgi:hypothetical protein
MRSVHKRVVEIKYLEADRQDGEGKCYLTVQGLDREQRDELYRAARLGGAAYSNILYGAAITDFVLPSDGPDDKFGSAEENARVYRDFDDELDAWVYLQILSVNGFLNQGQADRQQAGDRLGNSGSSSAASAEDSTPPTSESETSGSEPS